MHVQRGRVLASGKPAWIAVIGRQKACRYFSRTRIGWTGPRRTTAMSGGFSFDQSQFNRATQALRQPGSSFKPFVLAAALDAGISPDSVWESSGFDQLVCGSQWAVDNYEGGGSGPVSVRDATRRSVNGVYARLMEKLCPDKVAEMAERLFLSPLTVKTHINRAMMKLAVRDRARRSDPR